METYVKILVKVDPSRATKTKIKRWNYILGFIESVHER